MQIERTNVTKFTITGVPRLDPITVILEDIAPRRGKIIIECFGKSWSSYRGGMGERTIAQFFCACDEHYLAKNLSNMTAEITDGDSIKDGARRQIVEMRRGRMIPSITRPGQFVRFGRNDISAGEARDLWNDVEFASVGSDGWSEHNLMQKIFGDEWWVRLPSKPNPDYVHLCTIIKVVQEALGLTEQTAAT